MANPGGRGTATGAIWERTIVPVLEANYPGQYRRSIPVGQQLFGGAYVADFVIDDAIVVSAKWQQVRGTAEQKILYDIACLIDIIRHSGNYRKAYVVLGGQGFRPTTRQFLLAQRHREYLQHGKMVEVVALDDFIGRVNRRDL